MVKETKEVIKTHKKSTDRILFDYTHRHYTYDNYKEYCISNNCIPDEEDSPDYNNYMDMMVEYDVEYFLYGDTLYILNDKYKKFIIHGTLGLWNGVTDIYPKVFDNIIKVFETCFSSMDNNLIVWYDKNRREISFEEYHHDGVNKFTINALKDSMLTDYFVNMYSEGYFKFQDDMKYYKFIDILRKNNLLEEIII